MPLTVAQEMARESSIMNSVIEHLVFPMIATAAGTAVGGFLAYRFGKLLAQRAEFRREADALFNAIFPTIVELKQRRNIDTYEILNRHLLDHQRAVERFSLFLDAQTRAAFQKDWREYLCADGLRVHFLEKYADCGQLDKRSSNCSMAIARLEAVIRYAAQNR